jgi:beta-lactamase regulating signal transducer with metallopeptidase domain
VSALVLDWLGQALVWGTGLAIATAALLAIAGRRLPPAMHATLWLVVIAKFLVPVGPSWSLSLASGCREVAGLLEMRGPISPGSAPASSHPLATIAALAWAIGVAVIGARRLARHRRLVAAARRERRASADVLALVARTCARLGVRRVPDVRTSTDVAAPFVLGGRRPLLVLAARHLDDAEALETIVVHEIAHLRRGDLAARRLQWIAGTLFFFWPVLAWVNRRLDLARERACDEWALRMGPLAAPAYARCLLRAAAPSASGVLVAHAAGRGQLRERIDAILDAAPRRRAPRVLGLLLAAWALVALAGAAARRAEIAFDFDVRVTASGAVEVVRFGDARGDAALAALLAARPDADANGDGRLDVAELRRLRGDDVPSNASIVTEEVDGDRIVRRAHSPRGEFVTEDVVKRN